MSKHEKPKARDTKQIVSKDKQPTPAKTATKSKKAGQDPAVLYGALIAPLSS